MDKVKILMTIDDRVRVKLSDGYTFTGTITAIRGVEVIVRYDPEYKDSITKYVSASYDPNGCLTVHIHFVEVIP